MPSPERRRFPSWAEEERDHDLAWIKENWHVFWPASQLGYERWGRGALVVDTTTVVVHEVGEGSPLVYLPQEKVEEKNWADLTRLVFEYNPSRELVAVLLKAKDRKSAYRVGMARRNPPE